MLDCGSIIDETAASLTTITQAIDTISRSLSQGLTQFQFGRLPDTDFDVADPAQAERAALWSAVLVERLTHRLRETHHQIEAARLATDQAVTMVTDLALFVGSMMDDMASTRDFVTLMRASHLGMEAAPVDDGSRSLPDMRVRTSS